jgi:ketol-acid reductoisomerase
MANRSRAAILGFGNQGAAQAHCLRASGWPVVIGARAGGGGAARARGEGFEVLPLAAAAAAAEFVALLLPDEILPEIFRDTVARALRPGAAVVFAHGFAVRHGALEFPAGVDAVLVSPAAPGRVVRAEYDAGRGVPAYLAVTADASGRAMERAEEYATALGCARARLLRTTVEEEVVVDLFGEQTVLVGGLLELVSAAVDTLVAAGHSPAMAYLECAHQLKYLADLLHDAGPSGFASGVSSVAMYGALTRGPRIGGPALRAAMAAILEEVQDGRFAAEFLADHATGGTRLEALRAEARAEGWKRLALARAAALPPRGS